MLIKKVIAKSVRNSRGEKTIKVIVKTSKGKFVTSAPAGKSKGKFEVKSYAGSLNGDIGVVNGFDVDKLNNLKLKKFNDLKKVERIIGKRLGANSLFALEASLLKAMARENNQKLWRFLNPRKINFKIRSVGNAIGGGLHSQGVRGKKPDFQEFLFITDTDNFSECVRINKIAYKLVKKYLGFWSRRNDESAWETGETNERVLQIMKKISEVIGEKRKLEIGVDIASSSFYKNGKYFYKNPLRELNKERQINYIEKLIGKYNLFYVEDALEENDFSGFAELTRRVGERCLIVGDDLIATNPRRLKKAIKMKSINAVIVKPNQIGSLIKVREVIELAHKNGIKCIISHRSGETKDNTIADLGVGFRCDFIKTGIYGKVREAKLKRIVEIEKMIKK